ncbi:MAG: DUF655 domain-containing protein [Candidatus Heimdallarchaeota archaeon]|nr:DUF655 domain-containing protein [Candidatus Heimdallarchaeota archaeon]
MSRRNRGPPRSNRPPQRKYQKKYEEKGIILDILSSGNPRRRDIPKGETRIQVIGTTWFTLLEVVAEDTEKFMVQEQISLNKEEESPLLKIIGRIPVTKLSTIGERGLDRAIEAILDNEEKRFITWLNQAEAISIRLHTLQLIKGIGPKFMHTILDERKSLPFTSYEDFEERTKIKDIKHLIKQRILEEIRLDTIKYHLFTRSFPKSIPRK